MQAVKYAEMLMKEQSALMKELETLEEMTQLPPFNFDELVNTPESIAVLLAEKSKGDKRYLICEMDGMWHIMRLFDGADIKAVLVGLKGRRTPIKDSEELEEMVKTIRRLSLKYFNDSIDKKSKLVSKSIAEALEGKQIVPYTYLQKNTASYALFKNHTLGATGSLKAAIKACTFLKLVPYGERAPFNTFAEMYYFEE